MDVELVYRDSDGNSLSKQDYLRPQGAGHEARHSADSPPLPPCSPTAGEREASTATAPRRLSARTGRNLVLRLSARDERPYGSESAGEV